MNMVCDVVDRVLKSPLGALVHELNPDFKDPNAFQAHEVHRGNLSNLSISKKFVGGTVSNVQALPHLKTFKRRC